MDCPAPIAGEDHRLFAHARDDKIPGFGDLALMPDKEPGAGKDALQFLGVDPLVDENLAADLPRSQIDETRPVALSVCCRHGITSQRRAEL